MKKLLLTLVVTLMAVTNASAQYEQGYKYLGGTLNSFDLSYSKDTKMNINLGVNGGYMYRDKTMIMGQFNLDYCFSEMQRFDIGAKIRYYLFSHNSLFLSAGARFSHNIAGNYNDFLLTPEIGYNFFLNSNLAIHPAVYYDMSFSDFTDKSRLGFNVGLGWFF